jgi:multiple sugar transport system substrate-binding protein
MPDLFFCHNNNARALGTDYLVDWSELFTEEELAQIVPEFLADGMVDDSLAVFPVSKSTHLLFVAGGVFERFSADTGVSFEDLSTWDGFFEVAEKYYEWSGGKAFCAVDYPLRCAELYALSLGADDFYKDGWYDYSNEIFKACFMKFASSIAKGHITLSDMYSNTQVMTGEVACGIGSSASILYYNDTITYPDNTSEPMDLKVLALPQAGNGKNLVTQAGVGLACRKTTSQKAEAAAVFAKWLTQSDRNLDFVVETGYMPVKKDAFAKIKTYEFKKEEYKNLYTALQLTAENCNAVTEPDFVGYYLKVNAFYDGVRSKQRIPDSYNDPEAFSEEIWKIFTSVN